MILKTSYSSNQLRDYSSLFSRNEVQSWLRGDFHSLNLKIERHDDHWLKSMRGTYLDYLKHVYNVLEEHYQNEYILKNNFLNDWLIKEIGKSSSKVFNEFRVGNAVADLVMFNGSSKVFEIKTEYDTDQRLKLQLENYRKAFNQIFLIVPESKLQHYDKYDSGVGLITFSSKKGIKFEVRRQAVEKLEIEPRTIMDILHTKEYKDVVKNHYGELPDMNSFNQFEICSKLILEIPNKELNAYFIKQMKRRELENVLSSRYYREFNQLFLALKMNNTKKKNMLKNLKSPLKF